MTGKKLILASRSPRRRDLLAQFRIPFLAVESECPESPPDPGESPGKYACRLAAVKARDAAARFPGETVVGADTIVVLGRSILGKPSSSLEAASMIEALSGRTHRVITGVAMVLPEGKVITRHAKTDVRFRSLSAGEIAWYCSTGDGLDKAGGYGIQSLGGALIHEIRGDWFNVVGLPIALLIELLDTHCPELWPPNI